MVDRLKTLPRLLQIALILALLAIVACCGIVGLVVVWPTPDATPTQAAVRSVPTLQPTFTHLATTDTPVPAIETSMATDSSLPPNTSSKPSSTTPSTGRCRGAWATHDAHSI